MLWKQQLAKKNTYHDCVQDSSLSNIHKNRWSLNIMKPVFVKHIFIFDTALFSFKSHFIVFREKIEVAVIII